MVLSLDPIILNDQDFKGATIMYSHLEKGIELVKNDRIKSVLIWQWKDEARHTVVFDFLQHLCFI